jgi:hypothetical protein
MVALIYLHVLMIDHATSSCLVLILISIVHNANAIITSHDMTSHDMKPHGIGVFVVLVHLLSFCVVKAALFGNMSVLHLAIKDDEAEDILRHLPQCFDFIDAGRKSGGMPINANANCYSLLYCNVWILQQRNALVTIGID